VAVMQSGATVETATIGRGGVIGASAGLGARWTFGRAIVQLPGTAAWLLAAQFRPVSRRAALLPRARRKGSGILDTLTYTVLTAEPARTPLGNPPGECFLRIISCYEGSA
jgi:hypothetical protein